MKATGIVRRIDDLGRVVIPKEIRRTMRRREGDPLEIFTSHSGEVVFKKYSPVGDLNQVAEQYAQTLNKTCGMSVAICDRDMVIASAGLPKKEFSDRRVCEKIDDLADKRTLYTHEKGAEYVGLTDNTPDWQVSCLMPIITAGDVIGCVASLTESERDAHETETKLIETAAMFLSKQLEV